jgi:hypothetical protein
VLIEINAGRAGSRITILPPCEAVATGAAPGDRLMRGWGASFCGEPRQ